MRKFFALVLLLAFFVIPSVATDEEDAAADAVTKAFVSARQGAHLVDLKPMRRNEFRVQACGHDMRFMSGMITDVGYETSHLGELPETAQKLVRYPDNGKKAVRFGVGVCRVYLTDTTDQTPRFKVLIALYGSRWNSFWRAFWD